MSYLLLSERIVIMDRQSLGKRPREQYEHGEPSESSERRQANDTAPKTGSGLEQARKHYLRFTGTTWETHDQAGPSRQRDAWLSPQERVLIEESKKYIAHSGPDAWQSLIASIGPNTKEFFRDLVSKLPMEEQRVFGIQQPEESRRQQIGQIQNTMIQQHEVHNQADQGDHLKRNAEDIMQIHQSYLECKKMQGHFKNKDVAQSFFDSLPDKYRQELMGYCTTGVGSHDAEQIYHRWYELYRGISREHQEQLRKTARRDT
jgi:hypothetical protein